MQAHATDSLKPQPLALSPRQVVDVSSLSLRQVMKAIATGDLKSFKKGRRRIILREDLEAYLRSG